MVAVMMKLVEESAGIGELLLDEVRLRQVRYRVSRYRE